MASKKEPWLKRADNGYKADIKVLYPGPSARSYFDPAALEWAGGDMTEEDVRAALGLHGDGEAPEADRLQQERPWAYDGVPGNPPSRPVVP